MRVRDLTSDQPTSNTSPRPLLTMNAECIGAFIRGADKCLRFAVKEVGGKFITSDKFISTSKAVLFAELFDKDKPKLAQMIADEEIFTSDTAQPKTWFHDYIEQRTIEKIQLNQLIAEVKEAVFLEKLSCRGESACGWKLSLWIVR